MLYTAIGRALACVALVTVSFAQHADLRSARPINFPSETDSNSPALRQSGRLVVYNSTGAGPMRSSGLDQFHLGATAPVSLFPLTHRPYWIEATWVDQDGSVFGWYHHEPQGLCGTKHLTAPEIGALVSYDGGISFTDLGIVLSSGYPIDCSAPNGYFGGGNGDFTVVLNRKRTYFYFFFSTYGGPAVAQGVAVARMPFDRRYSPVGAVQKYYDGTWQEPGNGGAVTPIFPVTVAWEQANTDAYWGPSVHWNTYLGKYVMLLNRSCCSPGWPQEGIYISYNGSLANPAGWSQPVKILDGGAWYPQVIGSAPDGTDSLAGQRARFYMGGTSKSEIVFTK